MDKSVSLNEKNDLKENGRENFQGAVIRRFHFYELRDPPRKLTE